MNASRHTMLVGTAAVVAGRCMPVSAAEDVRAVRIGITGVEQQAEALYADELGLFKRAGLAAEITMTKGGAATVAALAGGALDVGCSNPISLGQALQRRLPFVMLLPGSIWDTAHPSGFAVVAPDAPIRSGKDLDGKVVGVPSLGGQNHLLLTAFIQQAGGDPATVKFIEIPESVTVEALTQGRIAMAYLDEPRFSASGNRIRSIGAASDAIAPRFAQTVWFTSTSWLTPHKPAAHRVIDALISAGRWATANPNSAAEILEKRLGVKEGSAGVRWATAPDPALIQVVLDRAAQYRMLPPLRAAEFFWNGT